MKNLFLAIVLACGMTATALSAVAQEVDAALLPQMETEVGALVVEHAGDVDALESAVENYVAEASDPVTAGQAVINVLTNPSDDAVRLLLAENPELKEAAARGLGSAIAVLGLTDPGAAAILQALIEASGDPVLQASAQDGFDERTAGLRDGLTRGDITADSTPETPASPN